MCNVYDEVKTSLTKQKNVIKKFLLINFLFKVELSSAQPGKINQDLKLRAKKNRIANVNLIFLF